MHYNDYFSSKWIVGSCFKISQILSNRIFNSCVGKSFVL